MRLESDMFAYDLSGMDKFGRIFGAVALAGSLLTIAACTPMQDVQIEQHHRTDGGMLFKRPIMVSLPDGAGKGVLAHRDYRNSVVRAFNARGIKIADKSADPKDPVIVSFGYRISDGQKVIEERSIPEYETFLRRVVRNGEDVFIRERRFVGYRKETYTRTVFTAELQMVMRDTAGEEAPVIFEANAVTAGSCGAMGPLIEPLATAILTEFPGLTGKVRRIRVEVPQC